MPMFEFQCKNCQHTFEELIFADEIPVCPQCASPSTERLLCCPTLHMPAPSRVGQTVTFPRSSKSACNGCSGRSCSTCK